MGLRGVVCQCGVDVFRGKHTVGICQGVQGDYQNLQHEARDIKDGPAHDEEAKALTNLQQQGASEEDSQLTTQILISS